MSLSRWLLLGALFYVLFALVRLPASVVSSWLAPEGASISGVSGSAWNGQAASISTAKLSFTDVRWSLKPWKLLLLKASADVNAKVDGGAVRTEINASLLGSSGTAEDLRGVLKLDQLRSSLQLPLSVSGNAGLRFERVSWSEGALTAADGEVQLADVTELTSQTRLGNFSMQFSTDDAGVITGALSDSDAVFKLGGALKVNPDRSFALEALVTPTADTPPTVETAVSMLGGSRGAQGAYTVSSQGTY